MPGRSTSARTLGNQLGSDVPFAMLVFLNRRRFETAYSVCLWVMFGQCGSRQCSTLGACLT